MRLYLALFCLLLKYLKSICYASFSFHYFSLKNVTGNSLAVQWLGLGAFTAGARVGSLVREVRSCKPPSAGKKKNPNKQNFFLKWQRRQSICCICMSKKFIYPDFANNHFYGTNSHLYGDKKCHMPDELQKRIGISYILLLCISLSEERLVYFTSATSSHQRWVFILKWNFGLPWWCSG